MTLSIAADVGTTTLAASLFDAETGKILAVLQRSNSQRRFGADVITRLMGARAGGTTRYTQAVWKDLAKLFVQLVNGDETVPEMTPAEAADPLSSDSFRTLSRILAAAGICRIALCGNTVMTHFLLGYPTDGLCEAPFTPYGTDLVSRSCEGVTWTVFPCIGSFLGGDTVSGIYALRAPGGPWEQVPAGDRGRMLIDLGTNGELVLFTEEGMTAASVAAGPAFEGGHLSCGMPSVAGAVCHVRMAGSRCAVGTIQNAPARGLCGTGAIEVLAALRQNGFVDANGTLSEPYAEEGFVLAKNETGSIRLTQEDIRQIQLAKGAVYAGVRLLRKEAGLSLEAPVEIELAGSFGSALSADAAKRIRLFPEEGTQSVHGAGNLALAGAMAWLQNSKEGELEQLAKQVKVLSLADHPSFSEEYVAGMGI